MKALSLIMEAWKVCMPVVADWHPLDDVKDPVPHSSENLDPDQDPHLSDADPKPTMETVHAELKEVWAVFGYMYGYGTCIKHKT